MVEAIVEHDYIAKEADELTIKKGDVIKEVIKKLEGWCEGSLENRRGLFPDNFVKLINDEEKRCKLRSNAQSIRRCRVVYSYKQDHEDELNLNVGDVIEIVGEEEEGWWRGCINGKYGVFPSNFVEEINAIAQHSDVLENHKEIIPNQSNSSMKPSKILCEVKYEYSATNEDELELKEGDIITLISKDGQDAGWWKGELNGKIGVFPDNFVAIMDFEKTVEKTLEKTKKDTDNKDRTKHTASQRKSQQEKGDILDKIPTNVVPPVVPNKKPTIPMKKSPSSGSGGLFSGLRKKIVDAVDGSSGSKTLKISPGDTKNHTNEIAQETYNAFDQVERSSMLQDVRASRAKAPGRRPPSVAMGKDLDAPIVLNGNSDYGSLEDNILLSSSNASMEMEKEVVMKPKVREWEKHKAPWLEEMKMNQAKRTSTSPGPETRTRLSSNEKLDEDSYKTDHKIDPKMEIVSPVQSDMSKSMPNVLKRTPVEERSEKLEKLEKMSPKNDSEKVEKNLTVTLRQKPMVNVRPQSIETGNSNKLTKTSPVMHKTPPSPGAKPVLVDKPHATSPMSVVAVDRQSSETIASSRQYNELLERLHRLEQVVERQNESHRAAIEDLKGRLQVESDMRMLLQAELEKVTQCMMQV